MVPQEQGRTQIELIPEFAIPMHEAHRRMAALKRFVFGELQEGVDYGMIPGTHTRSLWQPGAQKLSFIFGFYPLFVEQKSIEDYEKGLFMYRYKCQLLQKGSDILMGEAIATCSSMETKYRFRWVDVTRNRAEAEKLMMATPGDYRFKRDRNGRESNVLLQRIENPDIMDMQNTVCRMAQKRSYVAACVQATRAADIFSYDLSSDDEDTENRPPRQTDRPKQREEVEKEKEDLYGAPPDGAANNGGTAGGTAEEAFKKDMAQYKERLGDDEFFSILGAYGYETPDQVTPGQPRNKIRIAMQQALADKKSA